MLTEKQIDDLNEIINHPKFIEQIIKLTSTDQLNPDYLFYMLSETVVYMDEEQFYNFLALSETDETNNLKQETKKSKEYSLNLIIIGTPVIIAIVVSHQE